VVAVYFSEMIVIFYNAALHQIIEDLNLELPNCPVQNLALLNKLHVHMVSYGSRNWSERTPYVGKRKPERMEEGENYSGL
jgi:hypothetical protein